MGTNIVLLNVVREIRKMEQSDPAYEAKILKMNKVELLEEMMTFQEERAQGGDLSLALMVRGQILFKALETTAETEDLRQLARSYRRHLKYELKDYQSKIKALVENKN